jgi:hypothetical protein
MDNSINASERIVPDPNFITIEKAVVFPISIAEEDKIAAPIINIEWMKTLISKLRDIEMIFFYIFFDDNGKILAIFVENKYKKLFGIRINFSFYQNANYIYYLAIKFEINYKENRIIK